MSMQFSGSFSTSSQPSIFQAILEECSMKQIDVEESNHEEHFHIFQPPQEPLPENHHYASSNLWMLVDEPPYENLLQEKQEMPELNHLEFHRVKSLREEQENKIAQFLRDDRFKSLHCLQMAAKNQSPLGKGSQSLSPKKTKRIDKARQFKLIRQSD